MAPGRPVQPPGQLAVGVPAWGLSDALEGPPNVPEGGLENGLGRAAAPESRAAGPGRRWRFRRQGDWKAPAQVPSDGISVFDFSR
jgi:hypothetical protein